MAEQETELKCDVCGAVFRDADALTKHRAIHQGGGGSAEDEKPLEQGTEKPMQDPSINPPSPSPSPTL
jgi:hypothetical protein